MKFSVLKFSRSIRTTWAEIEVSPFWQLKRLILKMDAWLFYLQKTKDKLPSMHQSSSAVIILICSKSSVKCFAVILLLSLLWAIWHKSTTSPRAFETKEPRMTTKESHLWNVLIMWVVQRKTICLITSNWFVLTVKTSARAVALHCVMPPCRERE